MESTNKTIYDISWSLIFKVLAVLAGLWLLWALRDIIILLIVVGIIVLILEPFVAKLAEEGVPRPVSVIVLYLAILAVIGLVIYYIIPPVATQVKELALNIPYYTDRISQIRIFWAAGLNEKTSITAFGGFTEFETGNITFENFQQNGKRFPHKFRKIRVFIGNGIKSIINKIYESFLNKMFVSYDTRKSRRDII